MDLMRRRDGSSGRSSSQESENQRARELRCRGRGYRVFLHSFRRLEEPERDPSALLSRRLLRLGLR